MSRPSVQGLDEAFTLEEFMKTIRPVTIVMGLGAVACAVFVVSASATPPSRQQFSFAGLSFPVTAFCSFPVELTVVVGDVDETDFFRGGRLVAVQQHVVEQDSFSANGKTLTGRLYSGDIHATIGVDGSVEATAEGLLEAVPLPDGGLFLVAGRSTFNAGAFVPDLGGTTVNLDGFCAALAP